MLFFAFKLDFFTSDRNILHMHRPWCPWQISDRVFIHLLLKPNSWHGWRVSNFWGVEYSPYVASIFRLKIWNFIHFLGPTSPSSSSSSKPLLCSFQSVPLPDTSKTFPHCIEGKYENGGKKTTVSQLTVASGLSMESTGWSKVRWTSHPLSYYEINQLTCWVTNSKLFKLTDHDMWWSSNCKKPIPRSIFLCLVVGQGYCCGTSQSEMRIIPHSQHFTAKFHIWEDIIHLYCEDFIAVPLASSALSYPLKFCHQ